MDNEKMLSKRCQSGHQQLQNLGLMRVYRLKKSLPLVAESRNITDFALGL